MNFGIVFRIGPRIFENASEYSRHRIAIEEFVLSCREMNLTIQDIVNILKDEYELVDRMDE